MLQELLTSIILSSLFCLILYGIGVIALLGLKNRHPAVCLPVGLFTIVGVGSSLAFGRITYLMAAPAALGIWTLLALVMPKRGTVKATKVNLTHFAAIVAASTGGVLFYFFMNHSGGDYETVTPPYRDFGYFSMVSSNMIESGYMSIWSGALEGWLTEGGIGNDSWYHWGPLWLGSLLSDMLGLSAHEALLRVALPTIMAINVILTSLILKQVTRWNSLKIFGLSILATFFVCWPVTELTPELRRLFGLRAAGHAVFPYIFSFWRPFEMLYLLGACWCWFANQRPMAWLFLFGGCISAPHTFLALLATFGTLGGISVIRKAWPDLRVSIWGITAPLAAILTLMFVFDVYLPRSSREAFQWAKFGDAGWDALQALILALPLLGFCVVGLAHLTIGKKPDATGENATLLGWMGLSACVGGIVGYHLLLAVDFEAAFAGHLPTFTKNMWVYPIAAIGSVRLMARGRKASRVVALVCLTAGTACGVLDLTKWRRQSLAEFAPMKIRDVEHLAGFLKGQKFGYFASNDRQWWIPRQASLAAVLGSSCMRLNAIPRIDTSTLSIRYGSDVPYRLIPKVEGEDEVDWSFKLADKLGIEFIIEIDDDPMPEEAHQRLVLVTTIPGFKLYRIPTQTDHNE